MAAESFKESATLQRRGLGTASRHASQYSLSSISSSNDERDSPNDGGAERALHFDGVISLVSGVAAAFRDRLVLQDRSKDSIEYRNCFSGREAVDALASVLGTKDRKLAHAYGKVLGAQDYFHDVSYQSSLIDSPDEFYQLRDSMMDDVEYAHPSGVFVPVSDCYSSTCTIEKLCYAYHCPRRAEQRRHLNLPLGTTARRTFSRHELFDPQTEERTWKNLVSKEAYESTSETERKRQEAIYELKYTEEEYKEDMKNTKEFYRDALLSSNIIPEHRREGFVRAVFGNIEEIYNIHDRLAYGCNTLYSATPFVQNVGYVFISELNSFTAYVDYCANLTHSRHILEQETKNNPEFKRFLDENAHKPQFRKLDIKSFLQQPRTRLGRYPLLFDAILKRTPEGHPDMADLEHLITGLKQILTVLNAECGRAENRIKLKTLQEKFKYPKDYSGMNLKLMDDGREYILHGPMRMRPYARTDFVDITLFLFDHALVMARQDSAKDRTKYKIVDKPIPLQFLRVVEEQALNSTQKVSSGAGSKGNYAFSVGHLGRREELYTLHASCEADLRNWLKRIRENQGTLQKAMQRFEIVPVTQASFPASNLLYSVVSINTRYAKGMLAGTEDGIYVIPASQGSTPYRLIPLKKVQQLGVLDDVELIIALSKGYCYSYPLELLQNPNGVANNNGQVVGEDRFGDSVSFFKIGRLAENVVCVVRQGMTRTNVKLYKPKIERKDTGKKSFSNMFKIARTGDSFEKRVDLEFPSSVSSVHFFNDSLCVGCNGVEGAGFEVVRLNDQMKKTQALLHPTDKRLDFVRSQSVTPMAIIKIRMKTYLVCYKEFGLMINELGNRINDNYLLKWESEPQGFSFVGGFLVVYYLWMVEIRDVDSGMVQQAIEAPGLRVLNSDEAEPLFATVVGDVQTVHRLRVITPQQA